MNIQFKKGILELCALSLLIEEDRYGYELFNILSENIAVSEGTIYPLLRRLNQEGYFSTYLKESSEGPPRKYYRITEDGRRAHELLYEEWKEFLQGVNKILSGGKNE